MQILSKSLIKQRVTKEQSLLTLLIKDIGKGNFVQCQAFQDIQIQSKQTEQKKVDEQQDFFLDIDEENGFQQVEEQKKDDFNKFINIEERKIESKGNIEVPNLQIQSFNFVYGANNGNRTVQLIEDRICRAVGTNIFIENLIKPSKYSENEGHVYDISYLRYDKVNQLLYSGASNGKRSEIIQWRYNSKDKNLLFFQKKITLPSSCLSIFSIFTIKNQLICITKCSIQRQSQLLKIQLSSNLSQKKMKCQIKLGRIVNVLIGQKNYIVNENGLLELTETYELIPLYKSSQTIIALQFIDEQNIILGLINGTIIIFNPPSLKVVSEFQLSNNRPTIIKLLQNNQLVAITNKQQIILFDIDSSYREFKLIQNSKLEDICRNVLISKKNIICFLKKGRIEQFGFAQNKLKKKTDSIESKFNFGSITNNQTQIKQIIFNKQQQKYLYFYPKSKSLTLFQIQAQKIKKITSLALTHPIQIIDSFGNFVASICGEEQKQFLQIFDLVKNTSIIIQKKLPFPQCTCIKFSPLGDKLALGFSNGQTVILSTSNLPTLKQLCRSQSTKKEGLFHRTSLQQIIWNQQGNAIKTFSQYNLLYYLLYHQNDQFSLILYYLGNKKKVQGFQQIIKQSEWSEMGKFNYKNSKLMDKYAQITNYIQLKQTKDFIFASHIDGYMNIFNNPIRQRDTFQQLRWFRQPYKFLITDGNSTAAMLIYCKNTIFSVNLKMIE